jgi:dihydrofolate synthase / folylpolyglutamate synthase
MAATVAALTEEFSFRRLVAVIAVLADKDAQGELELLEPVVDAVVVTRNSSTRAMPVDALASLAADVFGEDRVHVEEQLPDAIATAVSLAEEDAEAGLAGAGVLITGSVMTVADARKLFRR